MGSAFVMRRRVEFIDTDMAGIVHFAAYFRYMETAEHELFREIGSSIVLQKDGVRLGWPRVSCGFNYVEPLRFGDEFEVRLGVAKIGDKSVTYQAEVVRDHTVLARGHSTSTCCEMGSGGRLRSISVPCDIAEKLREYQVPMAPRVGDEQH
jgi:YbgC/YbaW family acyl-CoA thioester hydrolase